MNRVNKWRRGLIEIKSFRLSEERIEKYNKILVQLGVNGVTESDKFRNLIDYLFDHFFESANPIEPSISDGKVVNEHSSYDVQKIDVLDLIINVLREHERKLDTLVSRLEKAESITVRAKSL